MCRTKIYFIYLKSLGQCCFERNIRRIASLLLCKSACCYLAKHRMIQHLSPIFIFSTTAYRAGTNPSALTSQSSGK